MKKIFYLLFIITNSVIAQKPTGPFDCNEIKFWQKQLSTNYKYIKLTLNAEEDLKSNRLPKAFDGSFFTKASDEDKTGVNKMRAYTDFKTEIACKAMFKFLNKELETCLKAQKYIFDKNDNINYVYSKQIGNNGSYSKFNLYIDPQSEIINNEITDNIVGYQLRLEMEYRKSNSFDDFDKEVKTVQTKASVKTTLSKPSTQNINANIVSKDVNFWENILLSGFDDLDVKQKEEGVYISTVIPTSFDYCQINMLPHEFRTPEIIAKKYFKTYKEAFSFFTSYNIQLKKCLKTKKYKEETLVKEKETYYQRYSKKIGVLGDGIVFTISIDEKSNSNENPFLVNLLMEKNVDF